MSNVSLKNLLNVISRLFWPSSVTITLTGSTITAQQHANSSKSQVAVHHFTHHAGVQSELFYAEINAFLQQLFTQPIWQRRGTRLLLGADLVRYFVVKPFSNARRLQDSIDAATHRFQQLYGAEDLKDWDIQEHWSIDQHFLACALPRTLLHQLKQSSQLYPLQIDAITPLFVFAWNDLHHHLSAQQWLLINEETHLVLGILDHARLVSVRVIAKQAQANGHSEDLTENLKREALSFDLPLPETVLLYGAMEAQWRDCKQPTVIQSSSLNIKNTKGKNIAVTIFAEKKSMKQRAQHALLIDFTPASAIHFIRKVGSMTWFFLACSVFVCGLLIVKSMRMQTLLNSNAAKIQMLEQKQKTSSHQKAPPVAAISTEEMKALNIIITELNTPWSDFFDALETGTSGINVLSIDPNIQKNLIRIQAESKTTEQMLDYLGNLNKSTLFKNPVLSKYEVNELDPNKPTRFSFELTWVPATK